MKWGATMKIQEVSTLVQLSKRAIKFYEEKGLLVVEKDENGYRKYSTENIEILERISVYRKLGMDIESIKTILNTPSKEKEILEKIYVDKQESIQEIQEQLRALEQLFNQVNTYHDINQKLEYTCIADGLCDMIPGLVGQMFMHHFLPYLQIPLETKEQVEAYHALIAFFDQVDMKITFSMKIIYWLEQFYANKDMAMLVQRIDDMMKKMLHPTKEEYELMKSLVLKQYKRQNRFLHKYSIFQISKRKYMQQLEQCGYNSVFLPNMEKLCPKYKAYRKALLSINARIMEDLGLYVDEHTYLCKK